MLNLALILILDSGFWILDSGSDTKLICPPSFICSFVHYRRWCSPCLFVCVRSEAEGLVRAEGNGGDDFV